MCVARSWWRATTSRRCCAACAPRRRQVRRSLTLTLQYTELLLEDDVCREKLVAGDHLPALLRCLRATAAAGETTV
jgi:hypothetical protein